MRLKTISLNLTLTLLTCVSCTAQRPDPRWLGQLVYDEANQTMLLYGGAGKDTTYSDLWILEGSSWRKLSGEAMPARIKSAFVYDGRRQKFVLFGGSGTKPLLDETWELDNKGWRQIAIPGPPARNHPMAAYDPKIKLVLLFGGFGDKGLLSDTWSYDGNRWELLDTTGPRNCLPHGMVYDEQKGRIVLVTLASNTDPQNPSKSQNQMWEWMGRSWQRITEGSVSSSSNSLQALAGFGKGSLVMYDGDDSLNNHGKTWIYQKDSWKSMNTGGPSPRVGHAMGFDVKRNRTLLFGGSNRSTYFNDLWEWDGIRWKKLQ